MAEESTTPDLVELTHRSASSHIYLVVTVREQKIRRWREFYDERREGIEADGR